MKSSRGASLGTTIAMLAFTIIVIGLVFVWKSGVWEECRAAGHSLGYCWSLVSR